MEQWKDIEGHAGYQVSDTGKIRSFHNNRHGLTNNSHPLKTDYNSNGYERVCLGSKFREFVHKLVAIAFIPNPNNYPVVRHRDDNRKNNVAENLVWGTQSDNIQDCIAHGRFHSNVEKARKVALEKSRTKVIATSLDDGESKTYDSLTEAANDLGLNVGNISNVLNGRQRKTGRYTFSYPEKGDDN